MRRVDRVFLLVVVTACSGLGSSPPTLSPEGFKMWCEAFETYQVARVAHWSSSLAERAAEGNDWLRLRQELLALDQPPELEGLFPLPVPRSQEVVEAQPLIANQVLDWVDEHCGLRLPRLGEPVSDA